MAVYLFKIYCLQECREKGRGVEIDIFRTVGN